MISSSNPKHSGLIDALNRIPEQDFSHIKRVGKACALSGGLLGFLFWNMVPQWMEYILLGFAALAWMVLIGGACTAAPLWATGQLVALSAQHDFDAVAAQLKILDPSLSEVLMLIRHKIDSNTCDGQWVTKVVDELHKHQRLLERSLVCTVENPDGEAMSRTLYKNLQL